MTDMFNRWIIPVCWDRVLLYSIAYIYRIYSTTLSALSALANPDSGYHFSGRNDFKSTIGTMPMQQGINGTFFTVTPPCGREKTRGRRCFDFGFVRKLRGFSTYCCFWEDFSALKSKSSSSFRRVALIYAGTRNESSTICAPIVWVQRTLSLRYVSLILLILRNASTGHRLIVIIEGWWLSSWLLLGYCTEGRDFPRWCTKEKQSLVSR